MARTRRSVDRSKKQDFQKRWDHTFQLCLDYNHEYYGHDKFDVAIEYYNICKLNNVNYLNNEYLQLKDVLFIGTTLYSDLSKPLDAINVEAGLSDFDQVTYFDEKFTAKAWQGFFNKAKEFLVSNLSKLPSEKVVVLTHFLPSFSLAREEFRSNEIAAGYASNLDSLISYYAPDVWIYGHDHNQQETEICGCMFVTNATGYPNQKSYLGFKVKTIEI